MILVDILHLFVGEDDASIERLGHEQIFAECTAALSEDLIRKHGDDGSKRKDEAVDMLHVEEVSRNSIGYRVFCQSLRRVLGQPNHLLDLYLNWIVVQLCLGDCLESSRALGQEGVAVHPVVAI